jgi:hypothetical protein
MNLLLSIQICAPVQPASTVGVIDTYLVPAQLLGRFGEVVAVKAGKSCKQLVLKLLKAMNRPCAVLLRTYFVV